MKMFGRRIAYVEPVLDVRPRHLWSECALLEEHAVHPDDVMSLRLEHRNQNGSDVTVVTGDENSHDHTFQGASPVSQSFRA